MSHEVRRGPALARWADPQITRDPSITKQIDQLKAKAKEGTLTRNGAAAWYAMVQELRRLADYYERDLIRQLRSDWMTWAQVADAVQAQLNSRQAAQAKWKRLIDPGGASRPATCSAAGGRRGRRRRRRSRTLRDPPPASRSPGCWAVGGDLPRWSSTARGSCCTGPGPPGRWSCSGTWAGRSGARKDDGAWSIPKGEHGADDDPLAEAVREFTEEAPAARHPPDPRAAGHGAPAQRQAAHGLRARG